MSQNVTPRTSSKRVTDKSLSQRIHSLISGHQVFALIAIGALLGSFVVVKFVRKVSADTTTPISIAAFGTPVTQNFDTLVSSGAGTLAANTPAGWGFSESGTNANTTYTAGTGSSNTGDTYSFGSTASSDRALGQLRSGSLISILGGTFQNNTGGTITSLNIAYTGEQWRLGATGRTIAERMDFQYSTNATSLTTGTWTDVDALDFIPPVTTGTVGALDGNVNHVLLNSNITGLNITAGATFWIRWTDVDATSSDDGLGIDDFSITANGITPTNPSGTGTANPNSVFPGDSTLLTVNVTPGNNPTSTGLAVVADLSSIGGSSTQSFSGSGNTFTYTATVASGTTPGLKSLPFTVTDAQSRSGNGSISLTVQAPPPPNDVVISQVYGGGGNTGATLKNDYIELINHSASPVNLNGWSVQAFVSTTSTWQVTLLPNFTLQPGQYFLIQESQGAGGTDNLPMPDAIGTIPVSSTSTKVALVNNTNTITAACPNAGAAGIVDLVGYGATDCFEGSGTAPTLDNTTADLRRNEGCFDTDDNANDFVTGGPNPRNSSSPTHDCTPLSAYGKANPSSVLQGGSTTLTVYVAAAQNPTSTGVTVTADLSSIGGSPTQSFSGSGNVFTFNATVPANNSTGMKSLPVMVADAQSRSVNTNILLSVLPIIADHITISQLYGGGGNSGATYTNDYVELYNPTADSITITGWSLQYASAAGTSWTNKQPLGGVIGPGEYYLVSLASGGANGAPLPVTPNISGDINMSATTGKIALVNNSNNLSGGCPLGTDPDIVDFVGYGTGATCHEGNANTPAPSNSTAIFRKNNGSLDSDQNGTDFQTGAPNPRRTAPIVELGPWISGTDPSTNDVDVPHDATVTVNFSEPVDVDPGWYNITCASTGAHNSPNTTEAHTNDFKTYAITPNVNFQFSEQCTVTIFKTAVHDQDTDDSGADTDTLFADSTWSFTVVAPGQAAPYPPSVHLTMGNPSNATPFVSDFNNFLMEKPTYSLSYNRDKGTPNWVSWHLTSEWYGTLARVDTFRPDPAVDPSWYRVQAFDYSGSGFDRGHMTPNADRDNQNRVPINQETYLMSNMVPQSPDNNQGPWAAFEAYLRTQSDAGNEIYIVSGPNGVGGVGSASGNTITSIANGHVIVPASTWKVALVLPQATGDDVSRVTCSSRTIAVLMPNMQGIRSNPWQTYLTTVDVIEQLTGYDFYSNLPPAVQACVEAGTNGTNPPGTANQSANTQEDTPVTITLEALRSNNNNLTFSIVNGPLNGSLGSVSAATCSGGGCTATVGYTPGSDYNGPDSFTFRASDGAINSNTSSVNIGITEVNDAVAANTDALNATEDQTLNFAAADLTTNDSAGPANESLQTLTVTSVTTTADTHGSVTLLNATVSYSPDANYNGPASFEYQVCDNGTTNGSADSKCATGTVNVTVAEVNDDVTAADDSKSTNEDTSLNFPASDLTGNDSAGPANESGQTLTVTSVTPTVGTHGTVSLNSGQINYSPASNYNGPASFSYHVCDNGTTNGVADAKCAAGTVNITVNPVNDPPVAVNDSYSTNEDNVLNGSSVLANDSDVENDSLTAELVSGPSHGTLTLNADGTFSYAPAVNYNGGDNFTYKAKDTSNASSNVATVALTINPVNDAPVANNDGYTTNSNTTLNVSTPGVLSNDTDIDGPSLSSVLVTGSGPNHGTLTLNADGSFSYSPALDYTGPDSFSYRAFDGSDYSNAATVNIAVNDTVAPVITSSVAISLLTITNSDLVNVGLNASATDNSGGAVTIQVAVFGDEDDQTPTFNKTVHSPDAKDIGPNNTLRLRGERVEANDGRVYLIIVTATDPSGNTGRSYHTVVVPKNSKQASIDSVNAQAAAAVSYAQTHGGAPPPDYFVIGDGPIIGPKQ